MTKETTRPEHRFDPREALCTNCVHNGKCVFQRNSPTPVLFCEEHEVQRGPGPVLMNSAPRHIVPVVPGLCGTCDNLPTCSLRSSEHITYHCEHYR